MRNICQGWRKKAESLKIEIYALYFAYKDPRVPWYAKALTACLVGYALSPIDLIPDPIPILGYLDDPVVIPLGVLLIRRLISEEVLSDCRESARVLLSERKPVNRLAGAIILAIWICVFVVIGIWVMGLWSGR